MNISEIWIRRPIMTTLVMASILIFGIFAYRQLAVSDLPKVDYPTISVSAGLPGASPETMAAAVATPLEQSFATIPGVDNMTSSSSQGSTNITLQFALNRDIDDAAADVQAAISKTLRSLPNGILPPSFNKTNPADSPILFMGLSSADMSPSQLNELAETFLALRISQVAGVAQVNIYGQSKYAVRVQLDPGAMASRGIGIDEVATAINANNSNTPGGVLMGPNQAFTIQASGQLRNAAAFRELVISYRNGAPVKLTDVGHVLDDVQNNRGFSVLDGKRNISLAVQRQPGANTVQTAEAVKELVERLKPQLPPNVEFSVLYDRSLSIRESVHDVQFTLALTFALVVLVIFLFLRNLSATAIPSLALPFSIIGTFCVMFALGYSLNNLSLMALTLAVGFVVDDAIVMLENIVRHLEMGKTPLQAALDGSREIAFTILSMTLSLVAVFIPIMFMPGLVGRLFREFAVTIGVAILVSGVVSLTLTPMLCSRYLRSSPHRNTESGFWAKVEGGYEWLLGKYTRSLGWVMNHRAATMAFGLITVMATVYLFVIIPKGFLPSEDTGRFNVTTEAAEGTSYTEMVQLQAQVAAIVAAHPAVGGWSSSLGGGGGGGSNSGRVSVRLKPRGERPHVDVVIRELQRQVSQVPGIQAFLSNPPPISIGGRRSKSQYQFTLQGPDIAELYTASRAFERTMRDIPQLQDVSSDLQVGNPQVNVEIDRARAASLGVTANQIESALYNAYGSRQVSTIYAPTNQYWVILELMPQFQLDVNALGMLYVRSQTGTLVALSSVARFSKGVGPVSVSHSGQMASVTLSFNTRPGAALGDAVSAIERAARNELPSGVTTAFSGDTKAFQDAQSGLLILLVIALFIIYVVLGILYESFVHPLTILSGLPFAAVGALLTLLIFKEQLTVYAFVGIIMLIGLVKKNAIMMIDFALDAEKEGKSPRDSILEACAVRFRPITMTTMAALMGTLPIALGLGAGAESRRPLGLAVVGGLAFSQVITLYVTPVVYTYMDEFQKRFRRAKKPKEARVPHVGGEMEPVSGD